MDSMTLFEENKGLVGETINRYFYIAKQQHYDDMYNIGLMILFKASRQYKATRGYKFSTYAMTSIRNEIADWLFRQTRKGFWRVPERMTPKVVSLSTPIRHENEETYLGDTIENHRCVQTENQCYCYTTVADPHDDFVAKDEVSSLLECLTDEERDFIYRIYRNGTIAVAKERNRHTNTIREQHKRILEKIRDYHDIIT